MKRRLFVFIGALLAAWPALADAALQAVPGHVPTAVTAGLRAVDRLPAARQMRLAIGLPLRDREGLTNLLQRLYDPTAAEFHKFLTPEEFAARFGPAKEDYQALADFVAANGLKAAPDFSNRALLNVSGSVADIEKLLHVTLRLYPHPREPRKFFAPDAEPTLALSFPILHISGLDDFLRPRPLLKRIASDAKLPPTPALGSGPGGAYMGNDFRAAYVPGAALTGAGQAVGLLEFDGYFASDVTAYRHQAALPAVPLKNVLLDSFNGAPGANNTEVSLDIDMANSMAPGLNAIIVYEGEAPDDVLYRMATDNLARQLSASWLYGIDPVTEEIFQQFAAQGQSFFNASGDQDAYAGSVSTPADDPNITVVGGTTLVTLLPGGPRFSETAWNWGNGNGTGGGISTTYPIPAWQQGVSMALNHGSTNMRNLPDVALTADNVWLVYNDGATGSFGGTSCATPLWAAFLALVNEQGLANGKPAQGFINPAVYALASGPNYAAAFHDITTGNNTSFDSPTNYFAVAGYDLCTGWGTPAGTNLINLLAPLDDLRIYPAAGLNAAGGAGGPFAPAGQLFVLTNAGAATLKWSLGAGAPWLGASISNGTLAPGGPAAVVIVTLNAAASNLVPGAYSASLQVTNLTDGLAQSRPFTLSVLTAPVITLAPTNQAVLGGAAAGFSASATGGVPLSFQWQQNGVNLTDGGNISGSSTAALSIAGVAVSNDGSYTLVASNAAGVAVSAPPAALSIIPSAPVITAQPASQYALAGADAAFTVAALGDAPFTYQWQRNNTNLSDGGGVSGSTNSSLALESVSAASAGTYSVIVSNDLGATPSAGAAFAVYALADTGLLQNGGFETGDFSAWSAAGNSSLDTVSTGPLFVHSGLYGAELGPAGPLGYISQAVATTPGATYLLSLWLDSPDGAGPNEFLVNWNGNILIDMTNMGAFGWSNFQFAVTATSSSSLVELGFRDDTSFLGLDDVSLAPLLNPAGAPVITAQPAAQTYVAAGGAASLSVGADGQPPLSYQWQSNNVPIPGATNAALSLSNIIFSQAASYNVSVSNSLGVALSSNAVLSILFGAPVLLTFDDLGPTNQAVPNGYAGLGWSNFYHMDTAVSAPNPSGYIAGTISAPNAAYNNFGTPAFLTNATPFDFLSAWVTAAWNDNLRLEVKGYASNALVYDQAYYLSSEIPMFIQFNCVGVTNIEFESSGGAPNPAYDVTGFEFVMDNASVIVATQPPPPNDLCADAIAISSDPYTNAQSTLGATSAGDPVPPCATNLSHGVWYQYTAPAAGELVMDTSASDFPAGIAIYTGGCGALAELACGQNVVPLAVGQTVYILIGAVGNVSGNLVLRASFSSATMGPPYILSSPASISTSAGHAANFAVSAEGQPPLNYFWQKNGAAIAGATNSSYTANNVQTNDSGAQITCLVSNALGAAASAAATLIVAPPEQLAQNGGFETGDFSSWTESGNFIDTYVNNFYVHSGKYGAALGPYGSPGYLSQALPTAPGQLYQISLWLDSPDGLPPNQFSVAWNGAVLFNGVNLPLLGWTNLQFTAVAASTNTLLLIGFRDDPTFLGLDDVSVLPLMSVLQNVAFSGGSITFQWSALLSNLYEIQTTTNLALPNWTPLPPAITATNFTMTTTEPVSGTNQQFFRVVLLP